MEPEKRLDLSQNKIFKKKIKEKQTNKQKCGVTSWHPVTGHKLQEIDLLYTIWK